MYPTQLRPADDQLDARLRDQISTILLATCLTLLPLCWMKLFKIGGSTLRPIHIVFGLLGLVLLPQVLTLGPRVLSVKSLRTVAFLFCVHLLFVGIGLLRPETDQRSFSMFSRLAIYFGFFLLLAELLTRMTPRQLVSATYWGACIGSVCFIAISVVIFAQIGRNLPIEYISAVAKFDVTRLRCGFYPVLFNYSGDTVQRGQEEAISGSFRHGICASFYCFFMLSLALRPIARTVMGNRRANLVGSAICWTAGFLMVTSVSRSISIAFFAALLVAYVLRMLHGRFRLPGPASLVMLLLVICGLIFACIMDEEAAGLAAEGFSSRFLDFGSNPRVSMFSEAIRESADQIWFGHGVGAPISQREQQVHNLVLGSLYEGGIASMFAAFFFYTALLIAWISACASYVRGELAADRIDMPWLLGMPMLPLITPMVSGAAGSFKLNDWVCLAFFFGLMGWFRVRSTWTTNRMEAPVSVLPRLETGVS